MRDAIRERLLEDISTLTDVWQPGMSDSTTTKPYAVVKYMGESEGNIRKSYNRLIEVWVYMDRTSYNEVDNLLEEIIVSLTEKDLVTEDGYRFRLECTSTSQDGYFDKDLEAMSRFVTFTHYLLRG